LRKQLIALECQVTSPRLKQRDRRILLVLASNIRGWKQTLVIVKPDTLVRWYQQGFKLFWQPTVRGQTWKTTDLSGNHAGETWVCDFVQTYDLFLRTVFVFFIIKLDPRRVAYAVGAGTTSEGVS
jgi:hypothetical protein